jgi:hypothetical protein
MTVDDVEDGMEPFVGMPHATFGLASRYDLLDLPATSFVWLRTIYPCKATMNARSEPSRARG